MPMDSETCAAYCFLEWEQFDTDYDRLHVGKALEKMNEGIKIGNDLESIHINYNGVWHGPSKTGGYISSYERIGYHAMTSYLMYGFLLSGSPIYVTRYDKESETEPFKVYRIK